MSLLGQKWQAAFLLFQVRSFSNLTELIIDSIFSVLREPITVAKICFCISFQVSDASRAVGLALTFEQQARVSWVLTLTWL